MTITLIVDAEAGDRLEAAFANALPGHVVRLPTFAVPDGGLAQSSRWRLCVGSEAAARIRLQGWRDGLIIATSRTEFRLKPTVLGPRDSLIFYDVAPELLVQAARLAIRGLTIFPLDLMPQNLAIRQQLLGFDQLTEADRTVISEMVLGFSNQQIAARLGFPLARVRQIIDRIFRVLACRNRTEVAVLAYTRLRPFLQLPELLPLPADEHA